MMCNVVCYECHCSYSTCELGSDMTDRLVQLVQEMQHNKSSVSGDGTLYGAKITGGGSGGTVCVFGRNCLKSSEQNSSGSTEIQKCNRLYVISDEEMQSI
ncbi:hypothetical protein L2E82_20124 [Cichorium intybus]|uniref:Uncharacterized protein n=1 Tax=Cichorium intybus TaxID=13427 RepID=A0ACB9DSU0_CICIN|nr:hypothetical protein L2E82_20124 [Cichorium intybus]